MEIMNATDPREASHFRWRLPQPFDFLKEGLPLLLSIGLGKMTSLDATFLPSGSSKEGDTACRSWLFSLPASTVQTNRCTPLTELTACATVCAWGGGPVRPVKTARRSASASTSSRESCG